MTPPPERPSDRLRTLFAEDWDAATRHRFTDALAAGTLPHARMAGYLVQDYRFIDGFVRLLASAVARAPSLAEAVPSAQFLGVITGPENTYFLRSFEALGIEDPTRAPTLAVTRDFQDLMRDAAASGRYEQMLAVLTVAEWSYLDWATPHADRVPDLPFYLGEWIALHCGPGFAAVVEHLRQQFDTAWQGLDPARRRAVEETFGRAVRLERAFFDAAAEGMPL